MAPSGNQRVTSFYSLKPSVDWVKTWPYLGVMLRSKSFDCSVENRIRKFYKCLNFILRIDGKSSDLVMLKLLESHCIPLLTYAIEIINVTDNAEKRKLRVAYNAVFRRIFQFRIFESVTDLQHFLGRDTWEELIEKRKQKFHRRCFKYDGDTTCAHFTDLIA